MVILKRFRWRHTFRILHRKWLTSGLVDFNFPSRRQRFSVCANSASCGLAMAKPPHFVACALKRLNKKRGWCSFCIPNGPEKCHAHRLNTECCRLSKTWVSIQNPFNWWSPHIKQYGAPIDLGAVKHRETQPGPCRITGPRGFLAHSSVFLR